MPDPLRHVRALTEGIGPRGAASPGEARAAQYIAEAARGYTHQVWAEPFAAFTSAAWPWCLILGFALGGGLATVLGVPGIGVALAVAGGVALAAQSLGWVQLGWLFRRHPSQNVVAIVPPQEALRERLVLIAGYDSAPRLPWPSVTRLGRLAVAAVALSVLLMPGPAMLSEVAPEPVWAWLSGLLCLLVGAGIVAMAVREIWGVHQGEAAGVAAALQVGEAVAAAPLQYTEVWAVFTGAWEPGGVGVRAFLAQHGHMLGDAHIVVLDGVAEGRVTYLMGQEALARSYGAKAIPEECPGGEVAPVRLEIVVSFVRALAERIDRKASVAAESDGAAG